MRINRPRQAPKGDDAMLPLINIVFLLLIFFMVAGQLSGSDPFEVIAPHSSSEGLPQADAPIMLLGRNGELALDGAVIEPASLGTKLQELEEQGRLGLLRLRADAQMDTPEVVAVMELLRNHGVERVHLITQLQRGEQW